MQTDSIKTSPDLLTSPISVNKSQKIDKILEFIYISIHKILYSNNKSLIDFKREEFRKKLFGENGCLEENTGVNYFHISAILTIVLANFPLLFLQNFFEEYFFFKKIGNFFGTNLQSQSLKNFTISKIEADNIEKKLDNLVSNFSKSLIDKGFIVDYLTRQKYSSFKLFSIEGTMFFENGKDQVGIEYLFKGVARGVIIDLITRGHDLNITENLKTSLKIKLGNKYISCPDILLELFEQKMKPNLDQIIGKIRADIKAKLDIINLAENSEYKVSDGIKNGKLNSNLLYDGEGSNLFLDIINNSSYAETKIEENNLLSSLKKSDKSILRDNLIDLGCGDGKKVKEFLSSGTLTGKKKYFGVDNSLGMLIEATSTTEFQESKGIGLLFEDLYALKDIPSKTLFLLGFTFGNLDDLQKESFLSQIKNNINEEDTFVLSVFMEQDHETINKLYKNKEGKEFIFNYFKKLGIDESKMKHYVDYGADKIVRIGVEFTEDVEIKAEWKTIKKLKGEKIECISSQRFSKKQIEELLKNSGFNLVKSSESNSYGLFVVSK